MPRAARALDGPHQGLQAELGRRRLLARRREPPDADPHLRDRVLLAAGARGAPGAPRAGARPRPPPPRPAARPVHAAPRSARDAVLAPGRGRSSCDLVEREVRRQLERGGYVEIKTPQVLDEELWHRSGHWDNYAREHVLHPGRGSPVRAQADELPRRLPRLRLRAPLLPRPARCASRSSGSSRATSARACCTACCAFAPSPRTTPTSTARSTRSPTRSTRSARRSTQLYARFGFDQVRVELSTRPDKSIGTDEQWERAEGALREALERQGREYEVSPGEGTFYGPKIDFHITDALGRSWQCGTCQLDFSDARALRPHLPGRRQRRAPAGDDPPGAARARWSASSGS